MNKTWKGSVTDVSWIGTGNVPLSAEGIDARTPALMNTDHMPVNKDLSIGIRDKSFPAVRDRWRVTTSMLRDRVSRLGNLENNGLSPWMAGCTPNGIVFMDGALGIGMQECHCSGLNEAAHGWLCLLKYHHWCRTYTCFHCRNEYETRSNERYIARCSQARQYAGISLEREMR